MTTPAMPPSHRKPRTARRRRDIVPPSRLRLLAHSTIISSCLRCP